LCPGAGHFLLAKLLLPHLEATARQAGKQGRLVVMSSSAHFMPYPPRSGGPIRLEDIDSPKGYHRMTAYGAGW
jgi:NAD(P)-dependent dehydrogenase (short-subunit alcohol dehydrogenase family)